MRSGLLCALLQIDSHEKLFRSPFAGLAWETFVCAQWLHRERMAGRRGSLFFWRDITREVDFFIDSGADLEIFEAKWSEHPSDADTINLAFLRNVAIKAGTIHVAVVCRTPNSHPLSNGLRAIPVTSLAPK